MHNAHNYRWSARYAWLHKDKCLAGITIAAIIRVLELYTREEDWENTASLLACVL